MITEILNFTTSKREEQVYLEKYHRYEKLMINTHLTNQNVDDYIARLKETFSIETDDLILLVVKYILPNKPENTDEETWKIYQEYFSNVWGFKVLNPKLF